MFNPSRDEVRTFFVSTWAKTQTGVPLEALELMASDWIREHPEYHAILEDPEAYSRDFSIERGQTNPFLHLAMHLSLSEQMSIDQPPGVRDAIHALAVRCGSMHDAMHQAMEALGEMLWESQRQGLPPDAQRYVEQLQRWARDSR
ncbi:MAG: hypothetical protein RLZZ290_185 [Pseudomonadota bacterium]